MNKLDVYKKKGVIQIKNDDNICLGSAIVVVKAKIEKHQILMGRKIQEELAKELHKANVIEDVCGIPEISKCN